MQNFNPQPTLQNDLVKIVPLKAEDFEMLYTIASDPLIWEQHPNKDRYKREVFETFFKGAIESKGAFMVFNMKTGEPIGSTRFYDFDPEQGSMSIGYTFLAKDHWGGIYNPALKSLMLNYAFQFVKSIVLHVGANNIRSQKAVEKLGGKKIDEIEMSYYGEPPKLNFLYEIKKEDWKRNQGVSKLGYQD